MNNYDVLISCSSWEDRFSEGLAFNNTNNNIDSFLLLGVAEFKEQTGRTSKEVLASYSAKILGHEIKYLSAFNDLDTWKQIDNIFKQNSLMEKRVLLDVSTMPRYLIWYALHFLLLYKNKIDYCYFTPNSYENCDWLTDEPMLPRLIFKHSGEFLPNRNSILIVQSGFDVERVSQLIRSYEPEKVLLGIQKGNQLNNSQKNNLKQYKENLNFQEIEQFEVDAFIDDHGYKSFKEKIDLHLDEKNIIVASFGPKISAVELMKLNIEYPAIGLVDVPVRTYNEKYSHGTNFDSIQKGSFNYLE
jgi:hypothetical protein